MRIKGMSAMRVPPVRLDADETSGTMSSTRNVIEDFHAKNEETQTSKKHRGDVNAGAATLVVPTKHILPSV